MDVSRRDFVRVGAMAGAALMLPLRWVGVRSAMAYSRSQPLQKFVQPLPLPGSGIPLAIPDTVTYPGCDYYTLFMDQYTQQLHPDLPKATTLWGYADGSEGMHRHLGPLIVAQRGRPVRMTVVNRLPVTHPLPVDVSLMGADGAVNRTSVHLHGGHVPWNSDGGPFAWFDGSGGYGESAVGVPDMPVPAPGSFTYYYPNDQSARLMWCHDHALGITRVNVYAGLAAPYLLRDPAEAELVARGLPEFAENGGREIPLVFQDKVFVPPSVATSDPGWQWGPPGDLWYAHAYEPSRWELNGTTTPADPSVVPEFFGDTMLTNGVVYPYLEVTPRRYRFRILNACQARFLNLQLYRRDGSAEGITLNRKGHPTNPHGPEFLQIGTEGGFLRRPVVLNRPPRPFDPKTLEGTLILAPAERADIVVDFRHLPPGTRLILYNDAPAPFPSGDPGNDFFPGMEGAPPEPGFGPGTRTLLEFRVVEAAANEKADLPLRIDTGTKLPHDPFLIGFGTLTPPRADRVRDLTLNEDFDAAGRLIQRLGTNEILYPGTYARNYDDPATENPAAGSTEVWRIFNLTGDTHPIHFHLANVQIVSRRPFDVATYNGTPRFTGRPRHPEANERGWKETVRMNPGECTIVIMKFDLPHPPFAIPESPRTGGHEYVWHCHILEHEEHDMMRPLVVK